MLDTQVLVDLDADRRLKRDGFVKLRLIDPAEAAELRQHFEDLAPDGGTGFLSDFVREDLEYRRAANEAIADRLDEPATNPFVGSEPFLRHFLCNHPREDRSRHLHRHSMYGDDRTGRHPELWRDRPGEHPDR